ncbi:XdhC family protein [Rhodobacteraceae bacterium M385]|nr:XdhC family protein [Rhodobacteraceae bacterium M385]
MRKPVSESIAYVEHPSDVLAHATGLIAQDRGFALITSVAIEGGAAREVGSLALVEDTGAMVGYLSNGCIDKDIQFHAAEALQSGTKRVVRYGNGSQFLDLKLPCGGALEVLIDPAPDTEALTAAHETLVARHPATLRFDWPEGAISFTYTPKMRLVLAGRGAVFRATAEVGKSAGFQIFLLSPDEDDIAATTALCEQPPVHLTSLGLGVPLAELDEHSAFLTLFHDHDWEPELLRAAVQTPTSFIGCLGSQRTHAARLDRLATLGVSATDLARVRGPIGLVPSLREAPLIALSAIAEVVSALPTGIRGV